jgi:hypothetical protein
MESEQDIRSSGDMKKRLYLSVILCAAALMVSCATAQKGPASDLAEAVRRYYDHKIAMEYQDLWKMERMSVEKDEKLREANRETYLSKIGGSGRLKGYEILSIGTEGSGPQGTTPVSISLMQPWPTLPMPLPKGDHVIKMEDLWEKIDGRWYHVRVGLDGKLY